MFKQTRGVLWAAMLSLALAACGGGGSISGNGNTTGSTTGDTSGGGDTPVLRLGVLNGSTFTSGTVAISQSPLASGGSSGLRVDIVDTANGNKPVTEFATVTFTSACVSSGQATITSPISTSTGSASSTYQAIGCSGNDVITATALVGGVSLQATGTIAVQAAPVASIQFSTATPNTIRIKGTGNPQTSQVLFKVSNAAGGPVNGQKVKFTLDTSAGGITLSPSTGTSGPDGLVQTTVTAGTVHTSVRVTAVVLDGSSAPITSILPAQSDSLVISTGLADQDSFSLSVGCFNIEGGEFDGTTTSVNIIASDRFNNPVPDGTAISFQAEGGQVQDNCLTTGGRCSVTFSSSSPRTADHRVTILATAVGEESFLDSNGNGQFDIGEVFTDLPEAFLDVNENRTRDAGALTEPIVDFNNNGKFDAKSGNFTGVLCKSGCDSATSLSVRADVPIIMSGSSAVITLNPSTIDVTNGAVAVVATISDSANQPMPGDSTIAAATTFGSIAGDANVKQACTTFNGPSTYVFFVEPPDSQTEPKSGVFTLKVTTPKGVVSSATASVIFNPNSSGGGTTPPGALKSLNFVSASPTTISIKGTGVGQPETSQVFFQVISDNGVPLPGQNVSFALDTTVGGITLDKASAVSDSSGRVGVNVSAGTVHTSVRVTATATSGATTVTARSDTLVISTGIADQDSISISTSQFNLEGDKYDGLTATITAHLADRFNNPVPDGTAVSFTTEGGFVDPQCFTTGGICTVAFRTTNPRNASHRYTILATAIGEESFTDLNGNGQYDSGEPFGDTAEAFLDKNENGIRDAASEPFVDFNSNGSFDPVSGSFTGPLCRTGCDTVKTINVRDDIVLVMSSSSALVTLNQSKLDLAVNASDTVSVIVSDTALQNMAKDTVISATTSYGTIEGSSRYVQLDTNGTNLTSYDFTVKAGSDPGKGVLTILVKTPKGDETKRTLCVGQGC